MILGLDASTQVCGWCILDNQHKVKEAGHIQFKKQDDLFQRLLHFRQFLRQLLSKHSISSIGIEAPAQRFKSKSSAHTISLLQRFNGMLSAAIVIDAGIIPELIEPSKARKLAGIPISKAERAKDTVVRHLQERGVLDDKTWQFKRTGKLKDWCFDVADACVVALAMATLA